MSNGNTMTDYFYYTSDGFFERGRDTVSNIITFLVNEGFDRENEPIKVDEYGRQYLRWFKGNICVGVYRV